ncbi:MAG: DNA mismatch repair endonuclease MutL [Clostridia bacterium]|nr:DNA mismatch repair endonuclease MutL [Clostridia bacterium]
MGRINVLDFEIANLIAAGEVVERPSSVIKELIENSIDSGATEITAEIKRGGVSLIRVTDNGCGMTAEDLPVALKRHATSKIRTREDLDGITTLGFRGEALAAISAVSSVTIITKTKEAECGTMLTSEDGKVLDISEVGASDGTTVVVEDLFGNVPARRKFLKKDSTEAMNVAALVEKVALSKPHIAIRLLVDGEERFATRGDGDLYNAIYSVFGKQFAEKMIRAEGTANGIRVSGYIGRSDNTRRNRNYENVFINGRYVKSLTAQAAIEKAYTSYIAPEGFPVCVLFIDMNPEMVDVNVHPAKLEVKFAGEQPVFEAIYHTVRAAIEKEEYRPGMTLKQSSERNPLGAFVPIGADTRGEQISLGHTTKFDTPPAITRNMTSRVNSSENATSRGSYAKEAYIHSHSSLRAGSGAGEDYAPRMTSDESLSLLRKYADSNPSDYTPKSYPEPSLSQSGYNTNEDETPSVSYRFIGEAYDCYLFVEYEGELLIIDKHAAHERVIFEELLDMQKKDMRVTSQQLLLPISVILSPDELSAAAEFSTDLSSVGFDFELFDKHANLTATPDTVSVSDAESLFVTMLDELIEGRGNPAVTDQIRREKALYQVACKAAIKGGRHYDDSILNWLISKLLSIPDITVCPHGRPVAIKLKKGELDRQFDRIK